MKASDHPRALARGVPSSSLWLPSAQPFFGASGSSIEERHSGDAISPSLSPSLWLPSPEPNNLGARGTFIEERLSGAAISSSLWLPSPPACWGRGAGGEGVYSLDGSGGVRLAGEPRITQHDSAGLGGLRSGNYAIAAVTRLAQCETSGLLQSSCQARAKPMLLDRAST